jgi:hypothetical protein
MVELVYDPARHRTSLVVSRGDGWAVHDKLKLATGETLVPYSPDNNLIRTGAVLLPSSPTAYAGEGELVARVSAFIHRYVDLRPTFERIAAHYVLLSWVYDAFNELPYLRFQGDYGTGKTRALLTIGALCYKPFFASGASTVSPIFHTLDAFAGTLVIDEGDFRFSDEKAEVVKILNNGNVRGIPVLRTIQNRQKEFNPRAFSVFGPKIVATRGEYEDRALESRFITEIMGGRELRRDIPINLSDDFRDEARELRNRLLAFRFARRGSVRADSALVDPRLEPRLNQILVPLLSVIEDETLRDELKAVALDLQAVRLAERATAPEALVLEALRALWATAGQKPIAVNAVADRLAEAHGQNLERHVTNRWVGALLRRLGFSPYKSHGVYVVPTTDPSRLETLCERYGISSDVEERSAAVPPRE